MRRPKKVLLLGAGGMGMAPLALYLRGAGVRVEAFDDRFSEPIRSHLLSFGVKIIDELNPIKIPDCIVHSSAVSKNDSRLTKFQKMGIPLYRRGDFLAELFARKRIIAVVGSHGKSSVTGRLVWALKNCGFETSYLVGAQFKDFHLPSGFYSNSKWVVMEVDESDGSIDGFKPWMTVALNCDWDHVDLYKEKSSFAETLKSLLLRTKRTVVFADTNPLDGMTRELKGKQLYPFKHAEEAANFLDANERAVRQTAKALGVDITNLQFSEFPGMERRQSTLFESSQRVVIEDYAHHPTEIASLLRMRGQLFPDHKLKVVFQPH